MLLIVCCLYVICLQSVSACPKADELRREKAIDSIKISACRFNIDFFAGLTTDRLLRVSMKKPKPISGCSSVWVDEEALKGYIARWRQGFSLVDSLDSEESGIDVRVVCLVYYNNAKEVDTLSFGANVGLNPPGMSVNGSYYKLDTNLLRMIADYIPEYRQDILHYVEVTVPKYEKMLDEYYREHLEERRRH